MYTKTSPVNFINHFIYLMCVCLCVWVIKWPAATRYMEQRYHVSLSQEAQSVGLWFETYSQWIRGYLQSSVSHIDRAFVFGLQELFQSELSKKHLAFEQQTRQLARLEQQLNILRKSELSESAQGKHKKNAINLVSQTVVMQSFDANYATASKLTLTANDRVLFAGDSLMQGVAPHANLMLHKQLPQLFTLDLSRQSTGLAYPGYFDWHKTIEHTVALHRVNVLIMFIGANDFYDIAVQGKKYAVGSQQWHEAYQTKVQNLIKMAHDHNVRVAWLEMPPMDKAILKDRVGLINEVYQKAVHLEKAVWINTRDLMGDATGAYAKFLPSASGSLIQVRLNDGVHFTVEGQKRIAHRLMSNIEIKS